MPKSKKPRSNTTPLNKRKFEKGKIKSPFQSLKETTHLKWSSWLDDFVPNIIWAVICVGNLDRDDALSLLRKVCVSGSEVLGEKNGAQLGHNYLADLSYEDFERIFFPLKDDDKARECCSALSLISSLPDHAHWSRLFPEASDLTPLAIGVAACLDHQSQESTDVRWAKTFFTVSCGRVHAPDDFLDQVLRYPDIGDMRKVRPTIRAFEMGIRDIESGSGRPEGISEPRSKQFWDEMMGATSCAPPKRQPLDERAAETTQKSIQRALHDLCRHFMENITTTSVDPRIDGAFGLAINMLTLTAELSVGPSNLLSTGRVVLRTIVDNYITLKYLTEKDDPAIWMQYRNYGSAQTALAFLKNSLAEEVPDSIDMDRLEALANEDAWLETKDIAVGNWANLNLRKMSFEAGVKDIYDSYYDWTSGFVHGHWGAVRDSSFTVCMNPLHRLHRVPAPANPMPPVLTDCCKVCNLGLEEIGRLYPSFKTRIDWRTDAERN